MYEWRLFSTFVVVCVAARQGRESESPQVMDDSARPTALCFPRARGALFIQSRDRLSSKAQVVIVRSSIAQSGFPWTSLSALTAEK
jgi:hypothetical protein